MCNYIVLKRQGFSLVELSIVLVILGLLTGGILAGQSLIRAAELRSISTQFNRYVAATQTFRDKYMALPGDMVNATKFWGAESVSNCDASSTTPSTTAATCDGNGSGQISDAGCPSQEQFRYWQQLANAGLIEGTYSGAPTVAGWGKVTPGTNIPFGKIGNGGWDLRYWGTQTNDGYLASTPCGAPSAGRLFEGNYGHAMKYGTQSPTDGGQSSGANQPLFTPEELWNIDTKMDDGKPGYGSVRSLEYNGTACNNVAQNDASPNAANASYVLTNKSVACTAIFTTGF